jgi:uncharacterized protein DUF4178
MVMSAGSPLSPPPVKPTVKAVNCPSCGASLMIRSMEHAVSLVCESCHSILDAKDPNLKILQKFQSSTDEQRPLIPLGTRGKWRGTIWEVIGFQRRSITVEGTRYNWREYLLFNPFKGFRYLTEYDGHWNDIAPVTGVPEVSEESSAKYLGKRYRHFQTAVAATRFVLGEFPWEVRVGERAQVSDYINPPYVLSSEKTGQEITWALGEYVYGKDLWKAFGLKDNPPQPIGVYENQPSPLRASRTAVWTAFTVLAGLLLLMLMINDITSQKRKVFQETHVFDPRATGEPSFVTEPFELTGRISNVQFETYANVNNQWIYLNYALINQNTGEAYDFGREVSYYYGYDSDGAWSEGNRTDKVIIPSIAPGTYYLRIEPESDRSFRPIAYSVTVTRDVPVLMFYGLAFLAILFPALLISWRTFSFEQMRWAESDHASPSFFDTSSEQSDDDSPTTIFGGKPSS